MVAGAFFAESHFQFAPLGTSSSGAKTAVLSSCGLPTPPHSSTSVLGSSTSDEFCRKVRWPIARQRGLASGAASVPRSQVHGRWSPAKSTWKR
jgi:hypothetical protein